MLIRAFSVALVAITSVARADVAPEVRQLIDSTYDSQVSWKVGKSTLSFDGCYVREVEVIGRDPLNSEVRNVLVREYVPRRASTLENLKTIVIVPPTGGENVLDKGYANKFCTNGFRAATVVSWKNDNVVDLDVRMHDRGAVRALAAVRHAVEYLSKSGAKQIGILGTSVGAMTATLVVGYEPRISAATVIVGGMGYWEIIGRSTEENLTKLRNERKAKFGWTQEQYEAELQKHLRFEPGQFAEQARGKKIYFIAAKEDIVVPREKQLELARAFGVTPAITTGSSHFKAILNSSLFHKDDILKFFKQSL